MSALRGTTVTGARLPLSVPSPTVSTVQRVSTSLTTSSAVSALTRISATPASSSTLAGRRHVSTAVGVLSSRATATRAAVDPGTAGSTVVSTTHAPALRASMEAVVLRCQTIPSG